MRNSKKAILVVLFLVICLAGNSILTFCFYPYNYARIDMHNIETKAYDDIFLGSSHGKCGINPLVFDSITGQKSTNLCMGGEYMQDVFFLAKEVVRNHKPQRIIYELDPGYWVTKPSQGMEYTSFYQEFPKSLVKVQYFAEKIMKADFRSTLFPWYVYRQFFFKVLDNVKTKTGPVYKTYDPAPFSNDAQSYKPKGFIYRNKIDAPKTEENLMLWNKAQLQQDTVDYFERLVNFCDQKQIELVVTTTPVPTETYQKYQRAYDNAHDYFTEYMKSLKVPYYDFNHLPLDGFDKSLNAYADCEGHMYGPTAELFTQLLAEYLVNKRTLF